MPYREREPVSVDWSLLAVEIGDVPGGLAVLRLLQAHGLDTLMRREDGEVKASCSIEYLVHTVHSERKRR